MIIFFLTGLDHEGIYRIGGNISQIQKLRCMVDQGRLFIAWKLGILHPLG